MTDLLMDTKAFLNLVPEALLLVSDDRVVFVNSAAKHLFGSEESLLVDRPIEDLVTKEDLQKLHGRLEASGQAPKNFQLRLRFRRPAVGEVMSVDCRALCVAEQADTGAQTVVLVLRDATPAVRAEDLIAWLALFARTTGGLSGAEGIVRAAAPMFDALGWWGAFLRTSPEGAQVVKLLAPNREDSYLIGFAKSLIEKGMISWDMIPVTYEAYRTGQPAFHDDIEKLTRKAGYGHDLASSMRTEGFSRVVWVPIRPEGRTSHMLLIVGPSLTEHDFAALQLLGEMIGAALRLEALQGELVRSERLAAVGEMSGVLAHELRNPLAVIFNAVTGLRKAKSGDEDTHGLLSIIYEEASRLKRVVKDLVDFSKPVVPQIAATDPRTVMDSTIEAISSKEEFRHVPLSVSLTEGLPHIAVDAHLLERVLTDLIENACQAVSDGGQVRITGESACEGTVRLRVRNDGNPISPDEAARVFQPFYTTRATGTGLGLTLAKRIVEDLGGKVTVDPDDSGASFSLWLPERGPDESNPEEVKS